ncbi:hypothetical protein F5Y12DRAFT_712702 [Xylaria sp. FL1777]|nr:hypothetical protein F5Y12DRAFT_712702 [Xylaria sp. FL1777]
MTAQMAMMHDVSALTALSGAAAAVATSAETRRRQAAYYRNPRSNPNAFNAAGYMNHLRAPAPSRIPPNRGPGAGPDAGIHIHYQGQCPHEVGHGLSYPSASRISHSEGYGCARDDRKLRRPSYADSPSSPCGCSRCYWRDFLKSDIEKYKATCRRLRETYIWNLHELYYVGRVREVYDNHCEHHRLLFRDVCLMWELPEKITLPEEDTAHSSRALTPHSRHSSSSVRTPIPLSRGATPLSRESGSRLSVATAEQANNKGKGKEVIHTGLDGDFDTPLAGSIDDDNREEEVEMKTPSIATPSESITKPQAKSSRTSIQRRFRQFWSTKAREKSSDKAELV